MKKTFEILALLVLILIGYNECEAQVYKLKAYQSSYTYYDNYYGWTKWSDWKDCKILITVDLYEMRMKIYSDIEQEYDIIETMDDENDIYGNSVVKCVAIDKYGLKCNVRIVNDKYSNKQIYVDYLDVHWVYNVYNLN